MHPITVYIIGASVLTALCIGAAIYRFLRSWSSVKQWVLDACYPHHTHRRGERPHQLTPTDVQHLIVGVLYSSVAGTIGWVTLMLYGFSLD